LQANEDVYNFRKDSAFFPRFLFLQNIAAEAVLTARIFVFFSNTYSFQKNLALKERGYLGRGLIQVKVPEAAKKTGPVAGQYFHVPWQSLPAIICKIGLVFTYTHRNKFLKQA